MGRGTGWGGRRPGPALPVTGRVRRSEVAAPTAGVAAAPSALPHALGAAALRHRRDPRPEPSLRTQGKSGRAGEAPETLEGPAPVWG